jgi:hypothetical protein
VWVAWGERVDEGNEAAGGFKTGEELCVGAPVLERGEVVFFQPVGEREERAARAVQRTSSGQGT